MSTCRNKEVSKSERLDMVMERMKRGAPYPTLDCARIALEEHMRNVEDEHSGIPENPDPVNSPPDGRMYPPADAFEKPSGSPRVRLFRQTRHRTWFGENGAVLIKTAEGHTILDIAGADGRTVDDLFAEGRSETD